jgi:hypothetical protein
VWQSEERNREWRNTPPKKLENVIYPGRGDRKIVERVCESRNDVCIARLMGTGGSEATAVSREFQVIPREKGAVMKRQNPNVYFWG